MKDLYTNNPNDIFEFYLRKFVELFGVNKYYFIHKNRIFYRARLGCVELMGRHNDSDITFKMPYHGENIGVPPALCAVSGRFNRSGYAFLYLATNAKTCVAEIHLEVGQICSLGKYKFVGENKYLNLCEKKDEDILELKKFLLMPVYKENKYYYHYTQFVAEIIKEMGYHGIVFDSIQSNGINVVSFVTKDFKNIKYNEKLLKAIKINYTIEEIGNWHKQLIKNERYLENYNEKTEKGQEKIIEYAKDMNIFLSNKNRLD